MFPHISRTLLGGFLGLQMLSVLPTDLCGCRQPKPGRPINRNHPELLQQVNPCPPMFLQEKTFSFALHGFVPVVMPSASPLDIF